MSVKIEGEKVKGIFLNRPNRFEAEVAINGEVEIVHVPNTGRMVEMLHRGAEVILIKSNNEKRKTKYTMNYVIKEGHLICINSILANRVFEDAFREGKINWAQGIIRREVTFSNSRFDFFVEGTDRTFIEIKCATYEEGGIAKFPDAPTERGRRHIDELIKAVKHGYKAGVAIVAFMDYVKEFTPNYNIDRVFGEKLREASEAGVTVKAYRCSISTDEIEIDSEMEIYF